MTIREEVIALKPTTTEREIPTRAFGESEVRNYYINKAKYESTGAGPINPLVLLGANADFDGNALSNLIDDGLVKPEQVEQVLFTRGYPADINSNISLTPDALADYSRFMSELQVATTLESAEAAKALIMENKPLDESEYFNRKMLAKAEAVEQRILKLMGEGMTRVEAEQVVAYNADQLNKMRQKEWRAHVNGYELFGPDDPNRRPIKDPTSYDDDLIARQYRDPLFKVRAIEDHIESIMMFKDPGWEARIIRLRKEQAMLMAPVEEPVVVEPEEPPPPPPILDFTTGDLEMPERFIIKDLKGFEFNPDTKFDGLRLPYDSCLFVLGDELKAVVLATQEDEDVITLKLLSETKKDIPWHATATLYARLQGDKVKVRWGNTKRSLDKRLGMVSSVLAFIAGEQLSEVEIETVITAPEQDVPPPKPGTCYNVVSLVQGRRGKRTDWKGGTHASPREHKRKGHWWPGKHGPIWIKAIIVNKGVLGKVDKEYHVTKLEGTNA
jgi:uncharacterized protein YoaH (UPF0181 family)